MAIRTRNVTSMSWPNETTINHVIYLDVTNDAAQVTKNRAPVGGNSASGLHRMCLSKGLDMAYYACRFMSSTNNLSTRISVDFRMY
jgi:hypothetical protein